MRKGQESIPTNHDRRVLGPMMLRSSRLATKSEQVSSYPKNIRGRASGVKASDPNVPALANPMPCIVALEASPQR